MLTVYEHNESVCCQKVRLVLAEKNIPHGTINVSFEKREQYAPQFLAVNPKHQVPVIVHHGRVITESTVIVEYLDEAFAAEPLMPKDPYWRARRRLWARWIDDEMHLPHTATISFAIAFSDFLKYEREPSGTGSGQPAPPFAFVSLDSEEMVASITAFQRFLIQMDRTLEDSAWLAGPAFSLADIDVVPYVWRLNNLGLSGLWAGMPRIQSWLNRVSARDSFVEQIINSALPEWIQTMRDKGEKAWPIIKKALDAKKEVTQGAS